MTPHPPLRRAACSLAIAALATLSAAAQAGEPVYWGARELTLPYRQVTASPDARPVLYVSTDGGRNWRIAAEAAPYAQGFRVQALVDGEHQFAVRTYNAAGVATPSGPLSPELTVVIDTVDPTILDATAQRRQDLVTIRVAVSDAVAIDPESVRVYAQAEGAPHWGPAPMQREDRNAGDERVARFAGQIRLTSEATALRLHINVSDRAGNRAEQSTTVSLIDTASDTSAYGFAERTAPRVTDPFQLASRGAAAPQTVTNPFAHRDAIGSPASNRPRFTGGWQQAGATQPNERPLAQTWPSDNASRSLPLTASSMPPQSPFRSATFSPNAPPPFDTNPTPRRVVGSRVFEFDYELESTGKWGVASVELWGTSDGGKSWRRFAIDSDLRSPIHVETPGEGDYGFKLVVTSVGGLAPPTPRPGDEPEAIVRVDLRRPALAITDVSQGVGYFGDQVNIAWTADDENPADNPIDLEYATRLSGPWTPIAAGLPDTGRYSWRLQRHIPRRVYLRITARDAGGNEATATTDRPIEIDVPTPAGTLRGVRSAAG